MHDHVSRSVRAHCCTLQIRDHPDVFPLHDVLEPAFHFINAHCVMNPKCETCFDLDDCFAVARNDVALALKRASTRRVARPNGRRAGLRVGLPARGTRWWSRTGSNRRPEACKATALPTELRPHFVWPQTPAAASAALASRAKVRGAHSRLRLFEPIANLARLELNAEGIARPTGRRARLRESRAAHEPHNGGPGRT